MVDERKPSRQEQIEAMDLLMAAHMEAHGIGNHSRYLKMQKWRWARAQLARMTAKRAPQNSANCLNRIKALEVPEPWPELKDFFFRNAPSEDCARAYQQWVRAEKDLEASRSGHADRERERLADLQELKALYKELKAREFAQKLEQQQSRWPKGVMLERDVYRTEGIDSQVKLKNSKIETQVESLCEVLQNGLDNLPKVAETRGYRTGNPAGVAAYIRRVLSSLPLPFPAAALDVKAVYLPESRQLVVEYELPAVDVVPTAKSYRYVKSSEKVVETTRPVAQVKALYANAIAQLTLLCLAAIRDLDTESHIDVVAFNGVVGTLDPRTGKSIRPCLITLRATRDALAEIDFGHVDPSACLKHLSAAVSKSPTELVPVRPVLEFSMVDPRFITATDAISGLDERPNLLELTPNEFEGLIQNLFEKMGLETRQTRASRDGGVDCVAYDTRPIFGGKVVIQAKRYKNTVGVSAVRDLYGTLQNEGASKGILVTTSGYGSASYDFAQNKPIELIEGANLLYLLETYTGVSARIEPPDDWQDPVPDSPEYG